MKCKCNVKCEKCICLEKRDRNLESQKRIREQIKKENKNEE
jgi:hypothetical protein